MKGDRLDAAKQRAQEKKEEEDLQRALAKTALGDSKRKKKVPPLEEVADTPKKSEATLDESASITQETPEETAQGMG